VATRFIAPSCESQFLQQSFQEQLSHWNRQRLAPAYPDDWEERFRQDQVMLRLEHGFIEELRAQIRDRAAQAPTDPEGLIQWFEDLEESGPGQHDALFPWLSEQAERDDVRWFLTQEAAGEAGFDDLVAMTQIKLPDMPKLELARNYWDEMGRGNAKGMHGPMLSQLVTTLDLSPSIEGTVWESLALANAMTAMATQRCYAWHSVGALGVIELTAPGRSKHVAQALQRERIKLLESDYRDTSILTLLSRLCKIVVDLAAAQHDPLHRITICNLRVVDQRLKTSARELLDARRSSRQSQQALRRHHDERPFHPRPDLPSQQMEILRGRGRITNL